MDAVPAHLRMNVAVSGRARSRRARRGGGIWRRCASACWPPWSAPSRLPVRSWKQRSITGVSRERCAGLDRSCRRPRRARPRLSGAGGPRRQRRSLGAGQTAGPAPPCNGARWRVWRCSRSTTACGGCAATSSATANWRAASGRWGGIVALADAVLLAAAWRAYFAEGEMPTTREAFQDAVAAVPLGPGGGGHHRVTREILAKRLAVADALDAMRSPTLEPSGRT